ncbi:MAG: glycine cleavage system protein T [Anaerolineae bacterium]
MYLFDRSTNIGRLELSDQDRFKLLHNMTTQDFNTIQAGEGRSAVLTTALARIIDQVFVYHRGESALLLTHHPQRVRGWLQRHIFFNDKVRLRDVTAELGQLELYGSDASQAVNDLAPGATNLKLHQCIEANGFFVAAIYPLQGAGYVVIAPTAQIAALKSQLLSRCQLQESSAEDYDRLRIHAGLPAPDHELTEDYIPLEAGLWDAVSFNKGCYIGQEIIARMESRGKLAKALVKLTAESPIPVGAEITAQVDGESRSVGTVTSGIDNVALGFVKPDVAEPGTQVHIGDIIAEVVDAPLLRTGFTQ